MTTQPFEVEFTTEAIADLRRRLEHTRWPAEVSNSGWDLGTNLTYLQELCGYWQTGFDFAGQAAYLNQMPQFTTTVDGYGIHYVHAEGAGPNPLPLVFTHGWPGTFFEIHKILELLTNPAAHGGDVADSFTVVVPSLPGYGYSEIPTTTGWGQARTAELWDGLMQQLGYQRYGAQGGDWGAVVTAHLGHSFPERVVGSQINMPFLGPIGDRTPQTDDEREYLKRAGQWQAAEAAYQAIQRTKPQTLAYGLTDSPSGLAGWITEKLSSWSDSNGAVETRFTKDEMLTNISIYWFTNTINSSTRYYYESGADPANRLTHEIEVPVGISIFPGEIGGLSAPRSWVERGTANLTQWSEHDRGGHFAAMEEPELLAQDIRDFFRPLR